MLRRFFWLTVGAAVGAWMVVRAQQAVARVTPAGVLDRVVSYGRRLVMDVRAAAAEGRRVKRDVEGDLRADAASRITGLAAPRQARPIEARHSDLGPEIAPLGSLRP